MWINYFKTSIRNFWRYKLFSFINLAGLTVGLICSILILLWVQDEMSVNHHFENANQILAVYSNMEMSNGDIATWRSTPYNLAQILEDEFPEVIEAVVFNNWSIHSLFQYDDKYFKEKGYYTSPDVFNVFEIPFLIGNPATALTDIHSMVISEQLAIKYFGENWKDGTKDVLAKVIRVNNRQDFKIAGVFKDLPKQSTLQFDFLMPVEKLLDNSPGNKEWSNFNFNTYLKVTPKTDYEGLQEKIAGVISEKRENASGTTLIIQPFTDTYLYSEFEQGKVNGGRITYARLFILVAIFILIIASINFMNLATARSATRAKEIGVRKVVGANRSKLIAQFLSESLLLTSISLVASIFLIELLLPFFNNLTDKAIVVNYLDFNFWLIFLGVGIFTGLFAGSYPALFLSSINIVSILKGNAGREMKGGLLRKTLVVFQFTMSVLLISGTLVVYQQLNYIKHKNLGIEKDNVASIILEGEVRKQYEVFKYDLQQAPGILGVSAANQNPLSMANSTTSVEWDGKPEDKDIIFHAMTTDYDFLHTMGIELKEGRDFSKDFSTDSAMFILNETAIKAIGLKDPIGKRFSLWDEPGRIIGVVKDFHISSMYDPIEPVILLLAPDYVGLSYIKIKAGQTQEGLKSLENIYRKFNPSHPFEYKFLDESFDKMYRAETVIGRIANYFAGIAIFISCLGLLGLAAFTAEQRRKEIGIRKVLGASEKQLLFLMAKDVTQLVSISLLIALPISYLLMHNWLNQFEYRADLGWRLFAISGVIAILVAWATISYQVYKATKTDPAVCLRTE